MKSYLKFELKRTFKFDLVLLLMAGCLIFFLFFSLKKAENFETDYRETQRLTQKSLKIEQAFKND